MEYIQLKQGAGVARFGIKTPDGKDTGEYIEIDFEDIELPLKVSECEAKHIENRKKFEEDYNEAIKKSKEKVDGLLSEQDKALLAAFNEYYKAEEEALDGIIGQGGTRKLLGGRKPYYTMYEDINEYLNKIIPNLKVTTDNLKSSIQAKYQIKKEDNIL